MKTLLITSIWTVALPFSFSFFFLIKNFELNVLITHTQLELRKKQFHVLLTTIQELQQTLESKY